VHLVTSIGVARDHAAASENFVIGMAAATRIFTSHAPCQFTRDSSFQILDH
jgi:hypothetical protein